MLSQMVVHLKVGTTYVMVAQLLLIIMIVPLILGHLNPYY